MNFDPGNYHVSVNGRDYRVHVDARGGISLWGSRRMVVPSTVYSAHPVWNDVGVNVSVWGRLGAKIMSEFNKKVAA